ncbi:hypothetical protein D3C73_1541730 [compost metagenome]
MRKQIVGLEDHACSAAQLKNRPRGNPPVIREIELRPGNGYTPPLWSLQQIEAAQQCCFSGAGGPDNDQHLSVLQPEINAF